MDENERMCDIGNRLRSIADHYCFRSDEEQMRDLVDRIDNEMVELPKDCNGRTLYINDEVLVGRDAQGKLTSLTLMLLDPAVWYAGPYMWLYGTGCGGLRQDGTERIWEASR